MTRERLSNVNLIVQRQGGHAAVSGYDRFAEFLDARVINRIERLTFGQRIAARLLRKFYLQSGLWYGKRGLATELVAARQWLKSSGQIFHFVYGENAFRNLGRLKRFRQNLIICTYHAPPERFVEVVLDREHLSDIDAILLVSNTGRGMFSELVPPDRVHFIPHGVDTEFFYPKEQEEVASLNSKKKCLFVGSHLRDFELLTDVIKIMAKSDPNVEFEVITLKKDHHYFDGLENIQLRTGISDEELRSAYQTADLLTLPLSNATANNSLLEAMACGMAIITTDLPGTRDYVDDDCACLIERGNAEAFVHAIRSLLANPERRRKLVSRSRERALDFSFERVAAMTEKVYKKIADQGIRSKVIDKDLTT